MTNTSTLAKSVMVVEDESVISLDIKNSLTKLGYAVSGTAASGDAALTKIERTRPDIILMDIHLKGEMTGIDVSRKVKSAFQIPVVYLTANADDSTFKEAQLTDPFGFVLKPFEEKELGIAIEIALNKHQKEQGVRASEHWYASAFQSLSEAIVATDPQGDVIFMNAAAESITGQILSDVIDRPITDLLRFQRKIQQFDQVVPPQSINSILAKVLKYKVDVPFPTDTQLAVKRNKCIAIKGKATVLKDAYSRIIGSLFMFELRQSEASHANKTAPSKPTEPPRSSASSRSEANGSGLSQEANVELIDRADAELVEAFTRAFINRHFFTSSTHNLIASAGEGWARLTSRTDGAIVCVKDTENEITAVVKEQSSYEQLICHFLVENSFFPVRRRSNGKCHYQYREIPQNCQVYRTDGIDLWNAWHGKTMPGQLSSDRVRYPILRENIVVFRRGEFYRIQKLVHLKENLHIKTIAGEIYAAVDDALVWGIQSY